MHPLKIPALVIIASTLWVSCATEGCYEDTEAFLSVNLYVTDAQMQTSIDSLTVYGTGRADSMIYQNAILKTLTLPMDPSATTCGFVISNGTITDTITVTYSGKYHFISKPCGYTYLYNVSGVRFTRNRLDNVLVINNDVGLYAKENLRAFY